MSRVVIPLAYSDMILSSKPGIRRWCFAINCGSKVPSRSRGVAIVTSPKSPCTVFFERPLRRFGARFVVDPSRPDNAGVRSASASRSSTAAVNVFRPKWTSISVSSIRSTADFIISRIRPLRSSTVLAWLANSSAQLFCFRAYGIIHVSDSCSEMKVTQSTPFC